QAAEHDRLRYHRHLDAHPRKQQKETMSFRPHVVTIGALVGLAATTPAQRPAAPPADLIVTHARIYTVDDSHPFVSALAVRDGRVQFVGSEREAMQLRGSSTRMLDAGGRTIIPGMIDAHAHLFGLGEFLRDLDLTDTRSYETIVSRVQARVGESTQGKWV